MRHVGITVALLVALASVTSCLEVTCEFSMKSWANMGEVYTCFITGLTVETDEVIVTNIHGSHLEGKTNDDVMKLNIVQSDIKYIPKGFEFFFPNIEGLRVAQCHLENLRQSDIAVFPKLRNCDMFNNRLKVLDSNLFEENLSLEYLYFGDNILQLVGHNILKPLTNLHTAVFQHNVCIKQNAYGEHAVPDLQKSLNEQCKDPNVEKSLEDAEEVENIENEDEEVVWKEEQDYKEAHYGHGEAKSHSGVDSLAISKKFATISVAASLLIVLSLLHK